MKKSSLLRSLLLATAAALSTSALADHYPLTIKNCGVDVTVNAKPERALIYNTPAIDNMMALGLGDQIYGVSEQTTTEYADNIPWAEARKSLKQLTKGDDVLSEEAILDLQPDLVYASYFWYLHTNETASRDVLKNFDIPSYLSPIECNGQMATPEEPTTFATIFKELKDLGKIFNVEDKADTLTTDLQARVDAVSKEAESFKPASALWYYAGTDAPYVAGCCGGPDMIGKILKLDNIYGETEALWPVASWEVVAEANPDFIIVGDLKRAGQGQSAEDKIAFLESNPVTQAMDAVKNKRYIVVPGRYLDGSVLSVWLLEQIAAERAKHDI
ncbi:ABC transporter substrate-binding protein [Cardiobacteriaceae bacterium TAE3-ERU3]|nr:ABC transporter substrate-binding protein [Cardiobacteriaceae bacterium TAE3-ERU3]